jgi:hypothetical protein
MWSQLTDEKGTKSYGRSATKLSTREIEYRRTAMNSRQIGWGSALCIVLAGNAASLLDDHFRSAKVSEKLSIIRELVSHGAVPDILDPIIKEASNCYAGYWRNC